MSIPTKKRRVLIVGGPPDEAEYLRQLLDAYGLEGRAVAAGPVAHGALFNFRPSLAVVFLAVEDADQLKLVEEMRSSAKARPRILSIVTPASDEKCLLAAKAGAHYCAKCNIDLSDLIKLIVQVV